MTARDDEHRKPLNGQVSYLEIPASDLEQSAAFYEAVFGWTIRRQEANRAFTAPGGLIGRWIAGPSTTLDHRLTVYVSVDSVDETLQSVRAFGGQVVRPPYAEGDLRVATFRDPGGNTIGVWQSGLR